MTNPLRGKRLIYTDVLEVRARKGHDSLWPRGRFKHTFTSQVGQFGNPDGTISLIPIKVCKICGGIDIDQKRRIWKNFRYPIKKEE